MCGGDKPEKAKQSEGEKAQQQVLGEKWNYYVQKLAPYQEKFIKSAQMTGVDHSQAAGRAATDTEAAFAQAPPVIASGQRGGNLGVQLAGRELAKTGAKAANLVRAGLQTDDRHAAGVEAIIAAGNGERADQQRSESYYSNLNYQQAQQDSQQNFTNLVNRAQNNGAMLGAVGALGYMGYKGFGADASAQPKPQPTYPARHY